MGITYSENTMSKWILLNLKKKSQSNMKCSKLFICMVLISIFTMKYTIVICY